MAPAATLAAWRARGAQHIDPLRFAFLEAMLRRTEGRTGATRRVLDGKLAALIATYGALVDAAPATPPAKPRSPEPSPIPGHSALADLAHSLARPGTAPDTSVVVGQGAATPSGKVPGAATARAQATATEPATLAYFRKTWSRLSADSRLSPSQARVPENAGPLNSHHLVHRALNEMRSLSPDYLHHFLAHVDTLMWLARLQEAAAAPPAGAARGEGERKPARARKGAKPG